ncbi:hypothetical protein [Rhodococcus aetherivorans]|nr:hypothetical protein [Rhodococcus aetherivorans]
MAVFSMLRYHHAIQKFMEKLTPEEQAAWLEAIETTGRPPIEP